MGAVDDIKTEINGLRTDLMNEVERRFADREPAPYYTPGSSDLRHRRPQDDPLYVGADVGVGPGKVSLLSAVGIAAGIFDPKSREHGATGEYLRAVRQRAMDLGVHRKGVSGATDAAGGYLIGSEILGIREALEAQSVAGRAGFTVLQGMVGNAAINVEDDTVNSGWFDSEAFESITEETPSFRTVSFRPHAAGCLTKFSLLTLKQVANPGVEQILRTQLSRKIALLVDKGVFLGTGSNSQPLGVLNMDGLNSVDWTGATYDSSAVATDAQTLARLHVARLREDDALRPGARLAWVGEPDAIRALESARDADGKPLFISLMEAPRDGTVGPRPYGIPSYSSSQLVSGESTALTLSLGDWSQSIAAQWGGIELAASDSHNGAFSEGAVYLRAIATLDVNQLHLASICKATDMDEADIPA